MELYNCPGTSEETLRNIVQYATWTPYELFYNDKKNGLFRLYNSSYEVQSTTKPHTCVMQGSFCIWAQPMRDNVTMQRRLALAGRIHKMISGYGT